MDYAEAGHLNRVNLLGMVNTEIRPGACKYCGIYGHLGRNCRNRMMQDFNQGEISSTSSLEEADESLLRDKNLTAANPDWRREQEKIKKTYLMMDEAGRISISKKKKKKMKKRKKKKKKKKRKRKKKKKYSSSSSTSSYSSSLSSGSSSSIVSRRSSRRRKNKKTRDLKCLGSEADVESMTEGVRYKMASQKKKDPIRPLTMKLKGFGIPDSDHPRHRKRKTEHSATKVEESSNSDEADVEESEAKIRPRRPVYHDLKSKKRPRENSLTRRDRLKRRSTLSERISSRRRNKRSLDSLSPSPTTKKRAGKRAQL